MSEAIARAGTVPAGNLGLDEPVTQVCSLGHVDDAYDDLRDGKNIRGVIHFGKNRQVSHFLRPAVEGGPVRR